MKLLKLSIAIAAPILLAAMFGNAAYTIAGHYNLLADGQNYVPLFCALAFLALPLFFIPVANLIYPYNPHRIATISHKTERYTVPVPFNVYRATTQNKSIVFHSIII